MFQAGELPMRVHAQSHISSDRFARLDRAQQYYECRQHDAKVWDFEGRTRPIGGYLMTPRMAMASAPHYVPLSIRRPSAPYRLAKAIVNAFTTLIYGHGRWPNVMAAGDTATQDFCKAIDKASSLPDRMLQARNYGGAAGSVALSWCFKRGRPRVRVHRSKHVHVVEWADREEMIPSKASELYLYNREEWSEEKRCVVQRPYWFRRDWTEEADVSYQDVPFEPGKEPAWVVDGENSFEHGDGQCHLVWIQNTPSDDLDGEADYDGTYENLDVLDLLGSVLERGGVRNLDPTLVLKMDADLVQRVGVKKGSDNAIVAGKDGDAAYLELTGTSIKAGIDLFNQKRREVLEVTQCVMPDPAEVAAQGVSRVALELVFAPMTARGDTFRGQYGTGQRRLYEQILAGARRWLTEKVQVPAGPDGAAEAEEAEYVLRMPPKVTEEPVLDAMGAATTEIKVVITEQVPGEATDVELDWPGYFQPTPMDRLQASQAIGPAVAGAAFLSERTAVEEMAAALGRNPADEWKRFAGDKASKQSELAASFGADAGGMPGPDGELPAGAQPRQDPNAPPQTGLRSPPAGPEPLKLNASDLAAIVTVNEARASAGLGPLMKINGSQDPDGLLTMLEFKTQRADVVAAAAKADKGLGPSDPAPIPVAPGQGPPGAAKAPPKAPPPQPGKPPLEE